MRKSDRVESATTVSLTECDWFLYSVAQRKVLNCPLVWKLSVMEPLEEMSEGTWRRSKDQMALPCMANARCGQEIQWSTALIPPQSLSQAYSFKGDFQVDVLFVSFILRLGARSPNPTQKALVSFLVGPLFASFILLFLTFFVCLLAVSKCWIFCSTHTP